MVSEHDEIAELVGAYALHAVDPDEAARVERHLEECPRCRAEVREHQEVAAWLGNSGADAPDGLWDRIASSLEEAPPPMRLSLPPAAGSVIPLAPRRRVPRGRFVTAAVGAAAAVVIGVLGVKVVQQEDDLDRIHQALEQDAVLSAANLALVDPDAVRARLSSPDGARSASAVVLPDGTGYLMVHDLPSLDADRTYQLWGQTGGGLISLGLLGSDPGAVVPFRASGDLAALAVTEEVAGGVVQSENPPTLLGRLD
jgi:anti-sigma factor RsiW